MLILDRAPRKSSLKAATTGVQFVAPGTLPTGSRPTLVYVLDGFLGAGSAPKLAAAPIVALAAASLSAASMPPRETASS
jgi:hypothetical protein